MLNMSGADPEGGGAGGARPPVLAPNSLKSPLNWPKYAQKLTPEPPASLLFQILDPPLHVVLFLF